MRYATFSRDRAPRLGAIVADDRIVDLATAAPEEPAFGSMLALIEAGMRGQAAAVDLVERLLTAPSRTGPTVIFDAAAVRLHAPIPRPIRNVFCVGLNYPSHVEQNARALGLRPEIANVPLFFTKPTTAVIGPGEGILLDSRLTTKLDYEVELGIVIGTGGTWISETEALDHVFGYTLVNDVSARDLQWRTSQMFIGKGLDSYCPLGPWIADRSAVNDAADLLLTCRVNGEERQRDSTANLIFAMPRIIAELSKGMTLKPGDVIATGTPGGCGYQMVPPRFLQIGDVVECSAPGLGTLVNPVVAWPGPGDAAPVEPVS
jgi:2-keto-4-pentenoate hydratase/2-oxohepta-3-ene-1,7-dioic acid hydratase in catechol pathway